MTETAKPIPADPMPNGPLGMYFFLASEAMFFVGLLGAFLVLQAGQRELFHHMASMLSTWETSMLLVLLFAASAALFGNRTARRRGIATAMAVGFVLFQFLILQHLINHHTIVQRMDGNVILYDGDMGGFRKPDLLQGITANLTDGFDVTHVTIADLKQAQISAGEFRIIPDAILQDASFGPSRNNFFGCYFLIVATHLVHLLVGIVAMLRLSIRTTRATPSNISCVYTYLAFRQYRRHARVAPLFLPD